MKTNNKNKSNLLLRLNNHKGVLFHLAGIVAIIWFLVRVLPKPDRVRYPCQQMSISIAVGYFAFWSLIWSAMFHGLRLWIKKARFKTAAVAPIILAVLIFLFSITGPVFGNDNNQRWDPIPKEPLVLLRVIRLDE